MLALIITIAILSFVIGGSITLIAILFLMGPDTPQKRADDLREWLRRRRGERSKKKGT